MSFSRVMPGGYGFGAEVTSSQFNQLDIDHANALDKTVAGDTLSGFVNVSPGGGGWGAGIGGAAGVSAGNSVVLSWDNFTNPAVTTPFIGVGVTFGIRALQNSAIVAQVANAIVADAPGAITSLGPGGITDGVTGGINITQTGGLKTTAAGGINLNGGGSDYVTYQSARAVVRRYALGQNGPPVSLGGGWTNGYLNGPFLTASATSGIFIVPLNNLMGGQLNGAVMSAASLDMAVGASHSMAGVTPPLITIARLTGANIGGLTGATTLFNGSMAAAANGPGTGFGGGVMQTFSIPQIGGSQVVDTSTYEYVLSVIDEFGGAAVAGNVYQAIKLTFSGITSAAPW